MPGRTDGHFMVGFPDSGFFSVKARMNELERHFGERFFRQFSPPSPS